MKGSKFNSGPQWFQEHVPSEASKSKKPPPSVPTLEKVVGFVESKASSGSKCTNIVIATRILTYLLGMGKKNKNLFARLSSYISKLRPA